LSQRYNNSLASTSKRVSSTGRINIIRTNIPQRHPNISGAVDEDEGGRPLGEEKKASFYDNIPDNSPYRKDPKNTNWYPLWMKVLSMLDDNEAFVDFGCGTGQFAELAF